MARLQFQLKVDGLEDESLVVRGFEGQESLSDSVWRSEPCYGFRYQVDLASALSNLTAEQFVDQTAHLTILRDGQVVQQINGIVRQFSKGDTGHRHTFYSLTLVPALERLSLRSNSRIFQQQTVPEIISILLQEMGIEDYAFALKRECAQREFCVQYRETDLQFLHRIAAEEGLVYSHLHEAQKHTLLFTDSSDSQPKLAKPVPYNALAGGEINLPYVVDLQLKTTAQVSHTELKDYSFKKPAYGFTQRTQGKDIAYQHPNYEHFDAPGRYKDDANGKAFSQIRLEYLRRDALLADAKSDEPLLLAGVRFDLQDHLDHAMNRDWLVVQANHQGTQPQALQEEGGAGATTYSNQLKLIPAHITWRARPCAKPQVDGPMIATVVGPQGEEIYCDNFGRVKVHFPWDRYSSSNEKSSCWVRVAQEWAGSQYGSMAIPRVGHEVIVSFLNGDPDQPIVTGRTYHATNTAPYALPDHKTKTVLRTETHQGQGYNELSFEDQAGSEQILLHAQKDWDALIEHDHTEVIRHDQHLTVDNDRFTRIQRNQHLTVEGEVRSKIALDSSHEVGASLQHKVGQRIAVEAGKEISLKSGAKIVVEAGAELTLKAGGSFVKVDAGGVHLVGPAINLNAGGSAGSGSAYGGQLAAAPRMLAQAKPVAELVQPDIAASMQSGAARVIDVASLPTMIPSSANNTANDEPVAEEKTPERILKSDLLKPSDELEKLAKRQASAYRQGNHSDEVKLLQEALIKLGFDLGKAGADGDFGSKTKTAIEQFQKSYQPSHQTHPSYSIGAVDGIVGKGTLLALDEALMDGWVYLLITKDMLNVVCPNSGNNKELLDSLNKYCPMYEIDTPIRIAHFLSQIAHESGCFSSLTEGSNYSHMAAKLKFSKYRTYVDSLKSGSTNKFIREDNPARCKQPDLFNFVYSSSNGNGDEKSGDGYKYRGRGLIQITGKDKYSRFTSVHNSKNPDDTQNFVINPDLVSENLNYAVESACIYWRHWGALSKKFNANGDINILIDNAPNDVELISQAVNGGSYGHSNGLDDRIDKFNKIKNNLGL
ncbi:type VI secretion system tip protein VgrG [Vibrio cholerae]|uniref:type VI secretion system tip protein TssI/VgrG n=1 Tax=Vibrio cholerae TaxID=666 RepID=UPI000E689893|nr:type VI secretion system tip protein TssI/VgrG [Vibrio cholerae]EGR1061848.1 type VI secretion system tip protein VgrG [Vibrio cholerae]EKO5179036.1 type VI secretion system tip protein VgrG [Vibrio cholerae]ELJ8682460.1 type VI secretion system tip protein VgrG [Vibrio cholerae]ELY5266550.1 type VI secretion system tip protein VgrG [Vibrio cholerae]EMC9263596.1 type VI secretion system tip protein VgrG [Vibrio cholerae]